MRIWIDTLWATGLILALATACAYAQDCTTADLLRQENNIAADVQLEHDRTINAVVSRLDDLEVNLTPYIDTYDAAVEEIRERCVRFRLSKAGRVKCREHRREE